SEVVIVVVENAASIELEQAGLAHIRLVVELGNSSPNVQRDAVPLAETVPVASDEVAPDGDIEPVAVIGFGAGISLLFEDRLVRRRGGGRFLGCDGGQGNAQSARQGGGRPSDLPVP